jgi:hypothetical protein
LAANSRTFHTLRYYCKISRSGWTLPFQRSTIFKVCFSSSRYQPYTNPPLPRRSYQLLHECQLVLGRSTWRRLWLQALHPRWKRFDFSLVRPPSLPFFPLAALSRFVLTQPVSPLSLVGSALCYNSLPGLFVVQGLLLGSVQGIGMSMFMALPSQWFSPKRRGLATGLATSGSGIGGGAFSLLFLFACARRDSRCGRTKEGKRHSRRRHVGIASLILRGTIKLGYRNAMLVRPFSFSFLSLPSFVSSCRYSPAHSRLTDLRRHQRQRLHPRLLLRRRTPTASQSRRESTLRQKLVTGGSVERRSVLELDGEHWSGRVWVSGALFSSFSRMRRTQTDFSSFPRRPSLVSAPSTSSPL